MENQQNTPAMVDKPAKTTQSAAAGLNKILAANITQWMKDADCRFVLMFRESSMRTFYALLFIDVKDSPLWGAELIYQFKLPGNFPQDPPSVECLTPNGQMDLGGPICLGIGEWHKDQWRGSLGIVGFVNYVWCCMTNMEQVEHGIRIIKNTAPGQLRKFAQESREYNRVDPSTHAIQTEFETKIRDYPNIPAIRALQDLRRATQTPKASPHKSGREPQPTTKASNVVPPMALAAPPVASVVIPATVPATASATVPAAVPATVPTAVPVAVPTIAPAKAPTAAPESSAKSEPKNENDDTAFCDYMSDLGL